MGLFCFLFPLGLLENRGVFPLNLGGLWYYYLSWADYLLLLGGLVVGFGCWISVGISIACGKSHVLMVPCVELSLNAAIMFLLIFSIYGDFPLQGYSFVFAVYLICVESVLVWWSNICYLLAIEANFICWFGNLASLRAVTWAVSLCSLQLVTPMFPFDGIWILGVFYFLICFCDKCLGMWYTVEQNYFWVAVFLCWLDTFHYCLCWIYVLGGGVISGGGSLNYLNWGELYSLAACSPLCCGFPPSACFSFFSFIHVIFYMLMLTWPFDEELESDGYLHYVDGG